MNRRTRVLISLLTLAVFQASSKQAAAESEAAAAPNEPEIQRCRLAGKVIGRRDLDREDSVTWSTDWAQPGAATPVGEDGSFEFPGLSPGRYRLCYRGGNILPTYYLVELSPGDNTCTITLPQCRLTGRIVGATYRKPEKASPYDLPVSGDIRVIPRGWTVMSGNRVAFVFADPAGRFRVDHLPPGDYIVRWEGHPGFVSRPTVRPGQEDVSVELRPPDGIGSITGSLQFERGGVSELAVHAFPKTQHGYDITVWNTCYVKAASTEYRIRDLPAGTYGVFVTPSGPEREIPMVFVPDVDIQPGEDKTVDLAIPSGRRVKVECDSSKGKPSMFRWDLVYPNGGILPDQAFVGSSAEGFLAVESPFVLPVGEYEIIARFGGDEVERLSFVLNPGDDPFTVRIDAPETGLADWAEKM